MHGQHDILGTTHCCQEVADNGNFGLFTHSISVAQRRDFTYTLLYRHTLGKIARLVDIVPPLYCHIVSKKL